MEPKDIALMMVKELERRAHLRGHGSIKQLTAHLGVGRTYFAQLRRGSGSLTVERLFAALDFLGVDWREFMVSVLGDADTDFEWGADPTADRVIRRLEGKRE
jgi:transcriptional regulator with XRE-family HTH domain